jgi:hypothetical protein
MQWPGYDLGPFHVIGIGSRPNKSDVRVQVSCKSIDASAGGAPRGEC